MVKSPFKKIIKKINFFKYRFRYLFNYIIIGFFSILLEILIIKYILVFQMPFILKVGIGFLAGVFLAFILNAKLNFKVPKSKNVRTFMVFLIISTSALILNLVLINILEGKFPLNYSSLRFLTATMVFMLSYTAHRKITFDFVKRIGLAIYLNEGEDIARIYSKIKYYADFIHLDLIDKSFNENAGDIDLSLIKEVDKTWGLKKMIHLMSKKPSKWVKKLNQNVDVFIFHLKIEESLEDLIKLCKKYKKKVGLTLTTDLEINSILKYLPYLDFVQIMGIDEVGESGHLFNPSSLDKLKKLNKLKKKYKFEIIFDGGIKPTNTWRINAKYIVSSSGLLSSENPVGSFMELKTSSRYHSIEQQFRDDILKEIKNLLNSLDFTISGNMVGTFAEEKGIKGISDIDIVLIIDELTKNKYEIILYKFDELRKKLQSRYGYETLINNSLGPLKFNIDSIVLHLMIYDKKLHKSHCIKSPFTCLDWQRTNLFFKKHISRVYRVRGLQPNNFFNARRNVSEYIKEIRENKISYRVYRFSKNRIFEEKKYKEMDKRHKIEFSYHILRFLISNFLKLYFKRNKVYPINEMLKIYFGLFPRNKQKHQKFIKEIYYLKQKQNFLEYPNLLEKLEFFIKDFEQQFKNYFYKDSEEIYFIRHAKTKLNKKNLFLGQKSNPDILKPDKKIIQKIKKKLPEFDVVFSSPLKRCINSLKLITERELVLDDKLKEIDYGKIERKDFNYLAHNYPWIIDAWEMGEDSKFPKGENSKDVARRITEFINNLKKYSNKKILVCTHNVPLRTIIGIYFKIPLRKWFKINIPYFEPIKFILTKDRKFYIELTENQIKEIFKNL